MRILHIGKYFDPFKGGIENFQLHLMNELAGRGVRQAAIVHDHEKGRGPRVERKHASLILRVPVLATVAFTPLSPRYYFMLRRIIRAFQPDLIHVHMPNPSAFWLLMRAFNAWPIVLHWHSDVVTSSMSWPYRLLHRVYGAFERRLLARSSKIIVTSQNYLDASKVLAPVYRKCEVVPLGLPDLPPRQSGTPRQSFKLLCIGRFTYYKGQEVLVRALALVDAVELDFVGGGEHRRAVQRLAVDSGLQERIRFHGQLSDSELQHLMTRADALVLPSIERTEAFGVVLLEAMRAGKPVIVSSVPGSGIMSVVEDGISGLMVPPEDHKALADAITALRDSPDLTREMGHNGRQRFLDYFQIEVVATRIEKLYSNLLSTRQ